MTAFLYFLPDLNPQLPAPKQEQLAAAGLDYAFDGRPHHRGVEGGPAGKSGIMLGCSKRIESGLVRFEATQRWQPHTSGKYFVGYYPDAIPSPDDLARKLLLDGYPVELADGRTWQVPLARRYSDNSTPDRRQLSYYQNLPQALSLNAAGEWQEQGPLPRYRVLWDLAGQWNDFRRGDPALDERSQQLAHWHSFQHQVQAAVATLQANYAVGEVECSLLGLFTLEHIREVLDLLIDSPTFDAIKKKWRAEAEAISIAAAAGSTSSPGLAAEPPITVPLSPT